MSTVDDRQPRDGQRCEVCDDAGHLWCSNVGFPKVPEEVAWCDHCGGMGAVEFPEFLPCPACESALYLAELVLCGLPTNTPDARLAAETISPTILAPTGSVEATAVLVQLLEQFTRGPGDPW